MYSLTHTIYHFLRSKLRGIYPKGLKQGLKPHPHIYIVLKKKVVMRVPLKQGLKQINGPASLPVAAVVMRVPLKQGLKLKGGDFNENRSRQRCYESSIKTRIETVAAYIQYAILQVVMRVPLKQGLKLWSN